MTSHSFEFEYVDEHEQTICLQVDAEWSGSYFRETRHSPEEFPELKIAVRCDGLPFDVSDRIERKIRDRAWQIYDSKEIS